MQQKENTPKHHNQYTPKDELVKNQKKSPSQSMGQKSSQQGKMDHSSKDMDQKTSHK